MLAQIHTAVLDGLEARPLKIEVDVRVGPPSFKIVGFDGDRDARLVSKWLREAMSHSGFVLPSSQIIVTIVGRRRDRSLPPGIALPIAIALLVATGQVPDDATKSTMIVGQLNPHGLVGSIRGMLQIAEQAARERFDVLIVPEFSLAEAAIVPGLRLLAPATLHEAVTGLLANGRDDRRTVEPQPEPDLSISMDDIRDSEALKTAFADAVDARAPTLLVGARGSGRTMLARRAITLMPQMDEQARLQVTRISSVLNLYDGYGTVHGHGMVNTRPFRAPHHLDPLDRLLGTWDLPGEVTLAHHGVLYIDEITAFDPVLLSSLRSAIRRGYVAVEDDGRVRRMPAEPLLIGSTSGCACGGLLSGDCQCSPEDRGRFDLRLDLARGLFDREILVLP